MKLFVKLKSNFKDMPGYKSHGFKLDKTYIAYKAETIGLIRLKDYPNILYYEDHFDIKTKFDKELEDIINE